MVNGGNLGFGPITLLSDGVARLLYVERGAGPGGSAVLSRAMIRTGDVLSVGTSSPHRAGLKGAAGLADLRTLTTFHSRWIRLGSSTDLHVVVRR